jgi:hypothetical protein
MMRLALLVSLAGVVFLAGCQYRWDPDPDFGVAVRNATSAQYLNPNAPYGQTPPQGMDGPAADASIKAYQKAAVKPRTENLGSVSGTTTK